MTLATPSSIAKGFLAAADSAACDAAIALATNNALQAAAATCTAWPVAVQFAAIKGGNDTTQRMTSLDAYNRIMRLYTCDCGEKWSVTIHGSSGEMSLDARVSRLEAGIDLLLFSPAV